MRNCDEFDIDKTKKEKPQILAVGNEAQIDTIFMLIFL